MKLAQITLTISEQKNANITDEEREKLAAELDNLACDFECFAISVAEDIFGDIAVGCTPHETGKGRVKISIDY